MAQSGEKNSSVRKGRKGQGGIGEYNHMLPKGLPVCPAQGSNYSCVRKFVHARMLSSVQLYPMDCTLPGFSVHGNFQARIMEWVAISYSRGSSPSRDRTRVSCIGKWILQLKPAGKPIRKLSVVKISFQLVSQGLYLSLLHYINC